jgi:NAD/NADP transhydrogenase alpha subunit
MFRNLQYNIAGMAIPILVGTINIAGGFLVTQQMLKMFRK